MTTATKSKQAVIEFLSEKKGDLFKIDFRLIDIIEGYNARDVYEDIPELAEDILEHGVQQAIMVKRNPKDKDRYLLIRGHRRLKACQLLNENGSLPEGLRIPATLMPKEWSEIDMLVDLEISNNGKSLTILQRAEIVKRLLAFGLTEKEIAKKLSKSIGFINNCANLLKAPESVKKMIRDGIIAPTLVNDIFRKSDTLEEAVEKIELMHAKLNEHPEGKTKITKKDELKAENKHNSVGYIRKIVKLSEGRNVRQDNIELFNFAQKLIAGEFSKEELNAMFFEPENQPELAETH
jgi:ParB family chromosome partitioning protein